VNPGIRPVGISVNTSNLRADERAGYLQALSDAHGLPAGDPLVEGVSTIADRLESEFKS
jgi:uncharacterized NAD-dependent epimerase/dehydratase family protein